MRNVKKYMITMAAVLCLLLGLTACGGSQSGTLTTEEYQAEVDAANTAMGEALDALNGLTATDEDSLREGVKAMRSMAEPLRDLAAIDNPPEEYAEAHEKVSAGCTQFADALDSMCDSTEALLDGDMSADEYNTALTDAITGLTEGSIQITDGLDMIQG